MKSSLVSRMESYKYFKKLIYGSRATPRCELTGCGCKVSSFKWYSDLYRYIYFETPKCASSTLKKVLPDIHMEYFPSKKRRRYLKFGVIRNPWDKMVSNYAMFVGREDNFRNQQIEMLFGIPRSELSFEIFIDLASKIRNHHWEQSCSFFPEQGRELDIIIRFEDFREGMQLVSTAIETNVNLDVRSNVTSHSNYKEYYTHRSKDKVYEMFKQDVELFGYDF